MRPVLLVESSYPETVTPWEVRPDGRSVPQLGRSGAAAASAAEGEECTVHQPVMYTGPDPVRFRGPRDMVIAARVPVGADRSLTAPGIASNRLISASAVRAAAACPLPVEAGTVEAELDGVIATPAGLTAADIGFDAHPARPAAQTANAANAAASLVPTPEILIALRRGDPSARSPSEPSPRAGSASAAAFRTRIDRTLLRCSGCVSVPVRAGAAESVCGALDSPAAPTRDGRWFSCCR